MLTSIQKREFVETIIERMSENTKSADVQKEIINLLMADTNNGKVYKYRAFNNYALSNLRERTLYCAVPSVFNDPFDCKMGMDFQTLFSVRYKKVFEHIVDYFEKFIQVYDGKISINDCTDNEQLILDKWFNSKKLCKFIKKYRNADITDAELKEVLIANFDVIFELISCFSDDSEFNKHMGSAKEVLLKMLSVMTSEQRSQVVDENATPRDYARILGIKDDADEISLIMRMLQALGLVQDDWVRISDDLLTNISRALGEIIDKQFRVGSLSTDYKNRLMWSHYAGRHTGFCVEYDFGVACNELKDIIFLPVIYSKERIKTPWEAAFGDYKEDEKVKRKVNNNIIFSLLTKDEVWSYENEWRIIVPGICGIQNVKMPPVSCIYAGALCSPENRAVLVEIAKEFDVPVKQMIVDRGEYMLHAQDCE